MKHWQAWEGTLMLECGKKRNGKPRVALVTRVIVAHTKSDAEALAKAYPQLKFVAKGRGE